MRYEENNATLLLPLSFWLITHMNPSVCLSSVCWNRFHNDGITYHHQGTEWCFWPGGPEDGVSAQHLALPWPGHPNMPAPSPVRTALLHGNTEIDHDNERGVCDSDCLAFVVVAFVHVKWPIFSIEKPQRNSSVSVGACPSAFSDTFNYIWRWVGQEKRFLNRCQH